MTLSAADQAVATALRSRLQYYTENPIIGDQPPPPSQAEAMVEQARAIEARLQVGGQATAAERDTLIMVQEARKVVIVNSPSTNEVVASRLRSTLQRDTENPIIGDQPPPPSQAEALVVEARGGGAQITTINLVDAASQSVAESPALWSQAERAINAASAAGEKAAGEKAAGEKAAGEKTAGEKVAGEQIPLEISREHRVRVLAALNEAMPGQDFHAHVDGTGPITSATALTPVVADRLADALSQGANIPRDQIQVVNNGGTCSIRIIPDPFAIGATEMEDLRRTEVRASLLAAVTAPQTSAAVATASPAVSTEHFDAALEALTGASAAILAAARGALSGITLTEASQARTSVASLGSGPQTARVQTNDPDSQSL